RHSRNHTAMLNILTFVVCVLVLEPCSAEENEYVVNDSSKKLSEVPQNLPTQTKILDLSINNISHIQADDFNYLLQLQKLNLSFNLIQEIGSDVFGANKELESIDLSNNKLYNGSCGFLVHLLALKYLDISYNKFKTITLGSEFKSLFHMEYLGLSTKEIHKSDLQGISHLELELLFLELSNLSVYELGSLQILNTKKLHIVLPETGNALSSLVLDAYNASYVLELTNVSSGDCLNAVSQISKSSKVTSLTLSDVKIHWVEFVLRVVSNIWHSSVESCQIYNLEIIGKSVPYAHFNYTNTLMKALILKTARIDAFYFNQNDVYILFANLLIENLTIYDANMLFMLCPSHRSKFRYLDFSKNQLPDDIFQKCTNFSALEILILRDNKLKQLYKVSLMTSNMSSLRQLDISRNSLVYDSGSCNWSDTLKKLNLSSNKLTDSVFKCLPRKVEVLDLQNNKLRSVPSELVSFEALKELNLGHNRFVDIPDCTSFRNLEALFVDANSIHVPSSNVTHNCQNLKAMRAGDNPFTCTCSLRDFISLTGRSDIRMIGWPESYVCRYPDTLAGTLLKDFHLSEISCSTPLLLLTILAPMLALVALISVTCHYFDLPWYLKMIWQWTRTKQRMLNTNSQELPESVVYHAFVSYSQHDSAWVKEHLIPNLEKGDSTLRLCQHERNFIPGKSIIENIINCIEKSYKSIFVLSPNFIQSEWCHYELYFAHHKLFSENSNNLILILLEPIPQYLIPDKYYKLKSLMAKRTYLEWPKDKNKNPLFWANLRAAIKFNLQDVNKKISSCLA
uniref:Toll like receptor 6 n=1 Tax=Latimeria chalumnae TaxID=7897 RepID=H3AP38_LATCH